MLPQPKWPASTETSPADPWWAGGQPESMLSMLSPWCKATKAVLRQMPVMTTHGVLQPNGESEHCQRPRGTDRQRQVGDQTRTERQPSGVGVWVCTACVPGFGLSVQVELMRRVLPATSSGQGGAWKGLPEHMLWDLGGIPGLATPRMGWVRWGGLVKGAQSTPVYRRSCRKRYQPSYCLGSHCGQLSALSCINHPKSLYSTTENYMTLGKLHKLHSPQFIC